MRHTSRTYIATLLMLVACFLFAANFAFAQNKNAQKMSVQQIVPVQNQDGVIDQEITKTMHVAHPDATGFIYRLDELWAPYVAPKEIEVEGGHEVLRPAARKGGPEVPDGAMQTEIGRASCRERV